MKLSRLFVLGCFLSVAVSIVHSQETIQLHFEVIVDGSTVGRPTVAIPAGATGRIEIDNVGRFAFTPTTRSSDRLAITFDIDAGGQQFRPQLLMSEDTPGSIAWTSDAAERTFELRVSWVR